VHGPRRIELLGPTLPATRRRRPLVTRARRARARQKIFPNAYPDGRRGEAGPGDIRGRVQTRVRLSCQKEARELKGEHHAGLKEIAANLTRKAGKKKHLQNAPAPSSKGNAGMKELSDSLRWSGRQSKESADIRKQNMDAYRKARQ